LKSSIIIGEFGSGVIVEPLRAYYLADALDEAGSDSSDI